MGRGLPSLFPFSLSPPPPPPLFAPATQAKFKTVAAVLTSDWCQKILCFSAQSEGRTAATVWNWSGKTLSPGALLAVLYFSSCHIFPPV